MLKLQRILVLILFFVWIFPLGVFIKPDKEKQACNGRRAICLCRHLIGDQLVKMGKPILHVNTSTSVDQQNSPFSNPDYLPRPKGLKIFSETSSRFNTPHAIYYQNPFIPSIEHVPKV